MEAFSIIPRTFCMSATKQTLDLNPSIVV